LRPKLVNIVITGNEPEEKNIVVVISKAIAIKELINKIPME
jgi:hypothetical protein